MLYFLNANGFIWLKTRSSIQCKMVFAILGVGGMDLTLYDKTIKIHQH
jgi:hypothetical protein